MKITQFHDCRTAISITSDSSSKIHESYWTAALLSRRNLLEYI